MTGTGKPYMFAFDSSDSDFESDDDNEYGGPWDNDSWGDYYHASPSA